MLLNNTCRTVKLIDFGLSRKILPGTEVREMLGTPEFVSPEVVSYDYVTAGNEELCLSQCLALIGPDPSRLCSDWLGHDFMMLLRQLS